MNPAAAITALNTAGLTVADIATSLGVTPSAVYRWRNSTRNPNPTNTAALRTLADNRLSTAALGEPARSAAGRAVDALTTDTERAELARLADSIRRTMQRSGSLLSTTRQADPFALCTTSADALDARLDALFA